MVSNCYICEIESNNIEVVEFPHIAPNIQFSANDSIPNNMKFTIETSLSRERVVKIIQDNTQAPIVSTLQNYKYFVRIWRSKASNQKTWTPQQEDKYFEGSVEEDSFKISRHIIGRGGAFIPIITGKIVEGNHSCSRIEISMGIRDFVILFLFGWTLFVFLHAILMYKLIEGPGFTHLIPDAIMLTVPFWAYVCYRYEVRKAKRKLNEMLGSCDL